MMINDILKGLAASRHSKVKTGLYILERNVMKGGPLFSVVVPTHNRAGLILKTLNTVLSQTHQSYEVVVVDDASTDNTEQILEPLIRAEKIRYIKHDQNYERAKSRNTGMENAGGDF